jgi:hypothetical protein
MRRYFAWVLAVVLGPGCTQHALRSATNLNTNGVLRLQVPVGSVELETLLRNHLKERRLLSGRRLVGDTTILIQEWRRDSSLRYHYLSSDTRHRHLSEWTAQWNLSPISATRTELSLVVLELIYIGDPRDAGPRPDPQMNVSEWYETPPDALRASLEARRFWVEKLPQIPLPARLSNIVVPSLTGPPRSKESVFYKRQSF